MAVVVSTRLLRLYATSPRIVPLSLSISRTTPISGNTGATATVGGLTDTATTAAASAQAAQQQALDAHNKAVAANAAADAAAIASGQAQSAVADKLSKKGSDILSGVIGMQTAGGFMAGNVTINSNGYTFGTGLAMTQRGLVGVYGNKVKFALSYDGSATFSGDIDTDGSVYAYGINTQTVTFNARGYYTARPAGYFKQSAGPAGGIPCGLVGHATSSNSIGVAGVGVLYGVVGVGNGAIGQTFGVVSSGNALVIGDLWLSGSLCDANGGPLRVQFSADNGATWSPILLRKG